MANITSAQVKEAIDQLAAMTAAASITPEAVASVMEKLRNLTDAERQQVVEVASAYLTEINTKSQEWLNRLLSTGGSADKVITAGGSNVQAELDTLEGIITGRSTISISFNAETGSHSSTKDKLSVSIAKGKTFSVTLHAIDAIVGETSRQIQVYLWREDDTQIGHWNIEDLEVEKTLTATSDVAFVSFYLTPITKAGTFKVSVNTESDGGLVKKVETISHDVDGIEQKIPAIEGKADEAVGKTQIVDELNEIINGKMFVHIFSGTPNSHSSANDRIAVDIKSGESFSSTLISVDSELAESGNQIQIYLWREDLTEIRHFTIPSLGEEITLTASENIAFISYYISKITKAGSFKATIKQNGEIGLKKKVESLNDDVNRLGSEVSKVQTQFSLIGAGMTTKSQKIPVSKGVKYRFTFTDLESWSVASMVEQSPSYNRLYMQFFVDGVKDGGDFNSVKMTQTPAKYYDYTPTKDGEINVCVRADNGCAVPIKIIDATYLQGTEDNSDEDVRYAMVQMNKRYVDDATPLNYPCVLLHFSDIHASSVNLKRIVDFQKKYASYLNDVICTGDVVYENINEADNGTTRGFSYWHTCGADKYLIAVGNHDSRKDGTGNSNTDFATEVYPVIYKPYISQWGVVQPSDAEANGLCYYYKDYDNSKLRLIVLDGTPQSKDGNRFDPAQQAWFASVLADAKAKGYAVVCASHYNFKYPSVATRTKNVFDSLLVGIEETNWSLAESAATLVDDFIEDGGEFVCWLAGHTHRDEFSILNGHNKQVVINVAESLLGVGTYGDMIREQGKPSQDCFNIISIDTSGKTFSIYRVGANLDRNLRKRESLCWDYIHHELMWQS